MDINTLKIKSLQKHGDDVTVFIKTFRNSSVSVHAERRT